MALSNLDLFWETQTRNVVDHSTFKLSVFSSTPVTYPFSLSPTKSKPSFTCGVPYVIKKLRVSNSMSLTGQKTWFLFLFLSSYHQALLILILNFCWICPFVSQLSCHHPGLNQVLFIVLVFGATRSSCQNTSQHTSSSVFSVLLIQILRHIPFRAVLWAASSWIPGLLTHHFDFFPYMYFSTDY